METLRDRRITRSAGRRRILHARRLHRSVSGRTLLARRVSWSSALCRPRVGNRRRCDAHVLASRAMENISVRNAARDRDLTVRRGGRFNEAAEAKSETTEVATQRHPDSSHAKAERFTRDDWPSPLATFCNEILRRPRVQCRWLGTQHGMESP